MEKVKELSYRECKWTCNLDEFNFETTKEVEDLHGMIGQERAVKAMDFGLQVDFFGYNIYVAGPNGTGRTSFTKEFAKKASKNKSIPYDWCYVYNFLNPSKPKALCFYPGKAQEFRREMETFIDEVLKELTEYFEGTEYESKKEKIIKSYKEDRDEILENLYSLAKQYNFEVKNSKTGIYFTPLLNGEEISQEQYRNLEESLKKEIDEKLEEVEQFASESTRNMKQIEKEAKSKLIEIEDYLSLLVIRKFMNPIKEKYAKEEKILDYLEEVEEDMLQHIEIFLQYNEEEMNDSRILEKQDIIEFMKRYKINIIVDHSNTKEAPVTLGINPTYSNLIGFIEYENESGKMITDFTKIKPGLFHEANGGFLVLQLQDVLEHPQSWQVLKRTLKQREIQIDSLQKQLGLLEFSTLQPEPIPMNIKVILIGSHYLYHLLYEYDEDFKKLFKIKCDFDIEISNTQENVYNMVKYIKKFCEEENQPHFSKKAVKRIVEYSARLAESKNQLTAQFNEILDILVESCGWAILSSKGIVGEEEVQKAILEKEYRLSAYEEKIQEAIEKQMILVDIDHEVIGQVNGLSVLDLGYYSFGRPNKITCTVSLGRRGVIHIEKESNMSGNIHDKGVLILAGYMGETYGKDIPLAVSIQLCFEQLYGQVDGDSASSAELYAILSNLAGIPIKQSIAVTGSINQKGEIQPVGGVNQKIEGFYKLCKKRGLTGSHGVIIPKQNVQDLMLKEEVIEDIKKGLFHIYPVGHIEEGIEILTGVPAQIDSIKNRDKQYSIYEKVKMELLNYANKANGVRNDKIKKKKNISKTS